MYEPHMFYAGFAVLAAVFIVMFLSFFIKRIKIHPYIRNTYFFWSILLFLASRDYFMLVSPPLFPVALWYYKGVISFLIIPILLSFCCVVLFCGLYTRYFNVHSRSNRQIFPILLNTVLLGVFLMAGEIYKEKQIENALRRYKPDCILVNSFASSVMAGRKKFQFKEHAFFTEGDKAYFWSYSLQRFLELSPEMTERFHCRNNRKLLSDGKLVKG